MLAHTRDKIDSAQARLARLRFGAQPLELLPSLDELRERITLHLSAAQPDQVPAADREPTGTAAGRAAGAGRGHDGAAPAGGSWWSTTTPRNVFAITSIARAARHRP